MTTHCPDCFAEIGTRKPGKDGRCDRCRPARRHSGGKPTSVPRRHWTGSGTPWSEKVGTEWRLRRTFLGIDQ